MTPRIDVYHVVDKAQEHGLVNVLEELGWRDEKFQMNFLRICALWTPTILMQTQNVCLPYPLQSWEVFYDLFETEEDSRWRKVFTFTAKKPWHNNNFNIYQLPAIVSFYRRHDKHPDHEKRLWTDILVALQCQRIQPTGLGSDFYWAGHTDPFISSKILQHFTNYSPNKMAYLLAHLPEKNGNDLICAIIKNNKNMLWDELNSAFCILKENFHAKFLNYVELPGIVQNLPVVAHFHLDRELKKVFEQKISRKKRM